MGAVKMFFQYLIPSPSYSCYSHLDDLGSIIWWIGVAIIWWMGYIIWWTGYIIWWTGYNIWWTGFIMWWFFLVTRNQYLLQSCKARPQLYLNPLNTSPNCAYDELKKPLNIITSRQHFIVHFSWSPILPCKTSTLPCFIYIYDKAIILVGVLQPIFLVAQNSNM